MPVSHGIARNVLDLIGHQPLVALGKIGRGLPFKLYGKTEFLNPGGSVKDRIGPLMIERAEEEGWLKPGGTIIEATSGNTGVGLAMIAAVKGYRLIVVMPDKMSTEKIRLLRAYGARVVITPTAVPPESPLSNYSVARRLANEIPLSYYPNQYENAMNPEAHYRTTAPEIFEALGTDVHAIVIASGTGGTVSGIGRYFHEKSPSTRIVAVDPKGSVLAHYHRTHELSKAVPYKVEGIGEDMIPKTFQFEYVTDFVTVDDRESFQMARRIAREEGLFVGGSSGSAVAGALQWADAHRPPDDANIVVILPDSGDRYLSKFYSDEWMRENGFIDETARVADILAVKDFQPALLSAPSTTTVRAALELLRKKNLSQMPVIDGVEVKGSIAEDTLMREVIRDASMQDRTIQQLLDPPFPVLRRSASLPELMAALKEATAVLVQDEGQAGFVGLLTRYDLLTFLSIEGGESG